MSKHPQIAIVTGSSRGIGRAIALRLASDGFWVIINYVHRKDAAESVQEAIQHDGGRAEIVQANIALSADRKRIMQKVDALDGALAVLVNNAGITSPGRKDLLESTEAGWDELMDTNLKGPYFLAQAAATRMVRSSATDSAVNANRTIVNISSISAYAVSNNRPDYCIAKAGMQMMTWLFANRLAENGIRVYEVSPGVIASDMTAPVKEKYDRLIADGLSPIRRWGLPEDVAQAVSSLVGGAFPFSTGDRINVDGGFHIRRL